MASLFEFYGLTRRQRPEDNTLARRESSSKRAVEDVGKGLALTSLYVFNSKLIIPGKQTHKLEAWVPLNHR
jgi:hypothetical protein